MRNISLIKIQICEQRVDVKIVRIKICQIKYIDIDILMIFFFTSFFNACEKCEKLDGNNISQYAHFYKD